MPTGEPVPAWLEPLPVDDALVDAAVVACLDAAAALTLATEERNGCLRWAEVEWRGPHHDLAIVLAGRLTAESVALAATFRTVAASIEADRQHVRHQNLARAAGRQQWLAEQGGG